MLIFTEMLYCTKYCNRTSTPINSNKLILSVASQQLSNDILTQVRRWTVGYRLTVHSESELHRGNNLLLDVNQARKRRTPNLYGTIVY